MRKFKHLVYQGVLQSKKLRDRSQYYPDLNELEINLKTHSQIGSGYKIAELGNLDEVYDRLAKFDIDDKPLNRKLALDAVRTFTDKIGSCSLIEPDGAYDSMNKSSSIGTGAQLMGIFSREDPRMYEYLMGYLEKSKVQR